MKFDIKNGAINNAGIDKLLQMSESLSYTPCQNWLGYFKVKEFDLENIDEKNIPTVLLKLAMAILPKLELDQSYNQILIQKYEDGDEGRPIFDPRDIKGKVISIYYGDFETGILNIDGEDIQLESGDMVIRQATSGFTMGPRYNVSTVEGGTLYALEFRTVVKEGIS